MSTATAEFEEPTPEPLMKRAARLASGMLLQDKSFAPALYGLIIIPSLIVFWRDSFTMAETLWLQLFQQLVELSALYLIGKRWVARFEQPTVPPKQSSLPLLLVAGLIFWCLVQLPALALLVQPEEPLYGIFGMLATVLAVVLYLTYYFYFFPIMLGVRSPANILEGAIRFVRQDRLLPLKAMVAPLAIMLLILNSLALLSPDNRIDAVAFLRVCSEGVFFLLSTYLAYAIGFVSLSSKEWRQLGFDPYRTARFSTIELQGSSVLARLLQPRNGLKMLLVAILIGLGNVVMLATMPPSADIAVQRITLTDETLTIKLQVTDPEGNFRSFLPVLLSVGGPEGEQVTESRQAARILLNGAPYDPLHSRAPLDTDEISVTLEFETTRTAENMKSLEDLYLWYRSAKIQLLPMQEAHLQQQTEAPEDTEETGLQG